MIDLNELYNSLFSENELVDIRRDIHKHAEPGNQEFRTSALICEKLTSLGIEVKHITETGVVGILRGNRPGKCVGIRADIDALPIQEENTFEFRSINDGVAHLCGHDIHTAILLGAAKMFASLKGDFPGIVKFVFQPAEERFGGAKDMIAGGCLEDPKVDHMIGLHVHPAFPTGKIGLKYDTMYASTNSMNFDVHGKSAHAATPENGVDPIVMTCNMVSALQTVVSRNTSPHDSVIITFGKIQGGTSGNQIPDTVNLRGTVRTLNQESRLKTLELIKRVCTGVTKSMGGSIDMSFGSGYDAVINNNDVVDLLKPVAQQLIGPENVIMETASTTYGEDFSFYAELCPSMYWHLGCKRSEGETESLHNSKFDPDEACIETGVKMQTAFALKLLGE